MKIITHFNIIRFTCPFLYRSNIWRYITFTNDPILRKLSDGRTDGQTDRWTQMDESDFIACCPNNVEHPKQPVSPSLLKEIGFNYHQDVKGFFDAYDVPSYLIINNTYVCSHQQVCN